jgi:SAM-dependent methyltransferase
VASDIWSLDQAGPALAGRAHWLRSAVNTFLSFPFLFDLVIKDRDFVAILEDKSQNRDAQYLRSRLLQKTLWFWPRIIDARPWVEGDTGKPRRPENFIAFDAYSSRSLCDAVERHATSKDAPILDLGCNVGRHLDEMRRRGFTDLTGVDAMGAALERMAVEFPETARLARLRHDLFQQFLRRQPDASFDVLYSHGATVDLVHPSFDIVRHMCRVTRGHVVLILNEAYVQPYPRLWTYEFARNGFFLREARRPVGDIPPADSAQIPSLLVYRRYR